MTTSQHRSRSPKSRAKLIALVIVLVPFVGISWWWQASHEMPVLNIPRHTMPYPNAFDTFNDAAALLLDTGKVSFAISLTHQKPDTDDREYTWAEKQELVDENAPAIALFRKGLDQEYVSPPARSFTTAFPYYAVYHKMTRLEALESLVKAHNGDNAGAVSAGMDAMELGEAIPHGSTLVGGLVGEFCSNVGRRPLWSQIDKLSAREALAALNRLERIQAKEVPFSEIMTEEKWATQASLLEIMRAPNSIGIATQGLGLNLPPYVNSTVTSQLVYMIYSKRRIMSDYTTYVDAAIARSTRPYGTMKPVPRPTNIVVQLIIPVYDQAWLKFVAKQTQNHLLEIALALQVYRKTHQSYPEKLTDLSPSVLPIVPTDPFAKDSPLHYQRTAKGYLLYSVGPDGKDDGGTAIDTGPSSKQRPNEQHYVKADSKGDIVAGKNIR